MSDAGRSQTRCRRCLEWNAGDPWYCPRCGKETTATPHDGGVAGDAATWVSDDASRQTLDTPRA